MLLLEGVGQVIVDGEEEPIAELLDIDISDGWQVGHKRALLDLPEGRKKLGVVVVDLGLRIEVHKVIDQKLALVKDYRNRVLSVEEHPCTLLRVVCERGRFIGAEW